MPTSPIRVLIAKPGLDGHDRGAKVLARALRDAGMEVIYTGLRQTPEMVAEAALQEDVDVVGLSILSGAHRVLVPRILEQLRASDLAHVKVFLGGIVPDDDVPDMLAAGVEAVFGPGTFTGAIIDAIRDAVSTRSDGDGSSGNVPKTAPRREAPTIPTLRLPVGRPPGGAALSPRLPPPL